MTFIESETIELKSSVVADLCKEVIAFANTKGGTLYIGVEDNGTVIGVDSADHVTLQINNMIRDSIKPNITMFVHYETQVINDKQIIAVTVQEGTDRPYYLGSKGLKPSGVYVHNGTSTDPASDTAIRKMIKETDGDSFETMRSLEQNLSFQAAEAQFEGLYRTDTRDYPEDALRETLMNSLVHRDYSFSASTLVSIYDDRIEFVSVGGLPTGIALDDIMLGLSVCRNPKLAAIFYRLQLIEAYGTGMPKIMKAYAGTGLEPKIEVTNNAFKITLPNRNAVKATDSVPNERKSNEEKILDLIAQNGYVVRSDVDQLLDVSQTTASRILKRMVTDGLIYQEGRGRKTKYRKG